MSAPIKVELFDLGPHNGMGEPDVKGSYHAFTLTEIGDKGDEPQRLSFMVPAHQLPVRANLCTHTDERVALKWTAYGDACWIATAPLFGSFRVEHYGNERWQALWSVPGYSATFVDGDFAAADDAKAAIEARARAALRDMGVE